MPEPRDRHRPEEPKEKAPDFQEFRLLDEGDASFFLKTFAGRASFETCIAAIKGRGYRDANIPVLIMKFGNDILRDVVLDRIDEYPDVDAAELFRAILFKGDDYRQLVTKCIAERIETFSMQPGFAERILRTEVLGTEEGVELFVMNLSHFRNLSPGVAQTLIGKQMRWAVLGHLSSFEPNVVDVPALIAEMQSKNELQKDAAQKLLDALNYPEYFAARVVHERCVLLTTLRHTGEKVEKNDDYRSSYEARRRALFFQALPDKALFASYQRGRDEHAAREVMYHIHEMGMAPGLAHDIPEMMEDLFAQPEGDFFGQVNRSEIRANMESAQRARDYPWMDPPAYQARLHMWIAEQKLVVNRGHVAHRLQEQLQWSHAERDADRDKRVSLMETIDMITTAGKHRKTVDHYISFAEHIALDPDLLYPEGTTNIFDGTRDGESDGIAFFDGYVGLLDEETSFALFERMMRTFEITKEAMSGVALKRIVKSVVLRWSGEQRVLAAEMIFNLFPKHRRVESDVHAYLLYCTEDSIRNRALAFFVEKGLPIDLPMIKTWERCSLRKDGPDTFAHEVNTIRSLEMERSGICTVLRREFGIENYSRYPLQLLIEQYDTRDDHFLPYGVVINPKTDYNGGFRSLLGPTGKGKDPLNDLYEQVRGKYRTRVYEAGSKLDVVRQLIKIKNRYMKPSGKKISFLLIGGHGNPGAIRFGEGKTTANITIDDLVGGGVASLGGAYFEPGATVILRSCSTGVKSGIGQQLSKVLGLKMIAPDRDTSIQVLSVDIEEDGELTFYVSYANAQTMEYQAGMPLKEGEN